MRIGSVSRSLPILIAGGTVSLILAAGAAATPPRAQAEAIARELGNAIFMPVLPYTPNDAETLPGTIGITDGLLAAMLERITEESILNGFRNVILMGVRSVPGAARLSRRPPRLPF